MRKSNYTNIEILIINDIFISDDNTVDDDDDYY